MASAPTPGPTPGLVLVVDDLEEGRALARIYLEMLGWTVEECAGGQQALDFLAHTMPQAIVSDISMPGLSGDELASRIREMAGPDLRLVGHTAHCREEELKKFKAAGFDHMLIKPASLEDMEAAFGKWAG